MHCQYCGGIRKNSNSLKNHERSCFLNPNRRIFQGRKGRGSWNKGLVGDPRCKHTDDFKSKCAERQRGKTHSEKTKKKLSEISKSRELLCGWNLSKKSTWYKGMYLHSSYELNLVQDLEKNGIRYERGMYFWYIGIDNERHRYFPDFYLPDYDVYLDPKNDYLIKVDAEKIKRVQEQNGISVLVLNKHQLVWSHVVRQIPRKDQNSVQV